MSLYQPRSSRIIKRGKECINLGIVVSHVHSSPTFLATSRTQCLSEFIECSLIKLVVLLVHPFNANLFRDVQVNKLNTKQTKLYMEKKKGFNGRVSKGLINAPALLYLPTNCVLCMLHLLVPR